MIYTVGHSTRTLDDFLALLAAHGVGQVVDVRRYPKESLREPELHRLSPHARVLPGGRLCYPAGPTDQMALC